MTVSMMVFVQKLRQGLEQVQPSGEGTLGSAGEANQTLRGLVGVDL